MANDRSDRSTAQATSTSTPQRQPQPQSQSQSNRLARREPFGTIGSPFSSLFQRWNEEMDRMFEDFGFGRGLMPPASQTGTGQWAPDVEMFQRGSELVVRAELPGMNKDDIHVDINDDALTIQGERQHKHEEEHEGWCRTEFSYGNFYRAIPLPEGTIGDSAKASFKDGVLEVVLQAPSREATRGRKLEIK